MNMFKLGILLVLGLVIIPYARVDAADSTTAASTATVQSTASVADTTQPPTVTKPAPTTAPQTASQTAPQTTQPPMTSIVIVTTEKPVTVPSIVSSVAPVQTTMVTPVESTAQSGPTVSTAPINTDTTTTTRLTTTAPAISPIFKCDFNGPCFGAGTFEVVTGLQFSPPLPLTLDSEPPRGPTSDALATINPTDNNEKCELPFRPQINSTTQTTWDMYFCYNEGCPTASSANAGCVLGEYGLIALSSSLSKVTVTDPLTPNVPPKPRDASGVQCLRFFYYFTVYDGQDWSQQIQFWNKPKNGGDRVSVGTFTANDMQKNKWNRGYIPLQRTSTDSVLEIDFLVVNDDRPTNAAKNQTINFAMDVVELYDHNCSYVEEVLDGVVRPVTPPDEPDDKPNLALILGLSLGIGIPVLLFVVSGLIYCCKTSKPKPKVSPATATRALAENIPMSPKKNANENRDIETESV